MGVIAERLGRIAAMACAVAPLIAPGVAQAVAARPSVEELRDLSLEQLADVEVTSVTKSAEALSDAPGAVYVISHDDILRSGARSVPEILRLAPNLQVFRTSASSYVVTARGFSGNAQAQAFSNKLLVLIDGRSVYTPLFSGVYWDMQDVLPEDIDRVEVISGPGATLWGANAVNGVINITTRRAAETQGAVATVGVGARESSVSVRYGGKIGANAAWRAYAKGFYQRDSVTSGGGRARDHWFKPQAGFRLDWTPSGADTVTLQGDTYQGVEAHAGPDENIAGTNLLARWTRSGANGSNLQVQGYFDRIRRATDDGGGRFWVDTFDFDVQHGFALGSRQSIVWGGGVRASRYHIYSTASLIFAPPKRTLNLANAFVQDSIALTGATRLILGLKLEDDPYVGVSALPSARLTWKATEDALLWASVSRAVRSPTPFDRDVIEKVGGVVFLKGDPVFRTEKLTAWELGARVQASPALSFSVSAYYNRYADLRNIESTPVTFTPLMWGNGMRGTSYGAEAWADWRTASWWRLSAGLNLLEKDLSFRPGASTILGPAQAGDDPKVQAQVKSFMNLGRRFTLDANLRYVGALPDPRVPSYVELDGRVGVALSDQVQLALSATNLLHDRHQEFPAPAANAVPRSVFAELRLAF